MMSSEVTSLMTDEKKSCNLIKTQQSTYQKISIQDSEVSKFDFRHSAIEFRTEALCEN